MAADLSSVLHALPQLDPSDLLTITAKAKALLSLSGVKVGSAPVPTDPGPMQDYLLEGIHHELRRRGLLGQRARIMGRNIPQSYVGSSYAVRQSLESYLPNLRPVEKAALGQLAARCLADLLEVRNRQVCIKTMLYQVGEMLVALDYAYPGYLQAGMLSWCWHGPGRE